MLNMMLKVYLGNLLWQFDSVVLVRYEQLQFLQILIMVGNPGLASNYFFKLSVTCFCNFTQQLPVASVIMFIVYHSNFLKVVPMSNNFTIKLCIFIFSPKTFVASAKYSDSLGTVCVMAQLKYITYTSYSFIIPSNLHIFTLYCNLKFSARYKVIN